jgi:hypothetical protein
LYQKSMTVLSGRVVLSTTGEYSLPAKKSMMLMLRLKSSFPKELI